MSFKLPLVLTLLVGHIRISEATSGMRITVTESTLQEVNQAELTALRNDLNGKTFSDASEESGGFSWRISNIHIPYVGDFQPSISLHSNGQVTWTCYINVIKVEANWRVKQDLGLFEGPSASGKVSAEVERTSIRIRLTLSESSGGLGIRLSDCSTSVGDLDLDFESNAILDPILNTLSDFFENDLERHLSEEICRQVKTGMTGLAEDMKHLDTSLPIKVIGIPLRLDNAFTKVSVSTDTITTYHKGAIQWNGKSFQSFDTTTFPTGMTTLGIAFDLKEDVVNTLLQAIVDSGQLDGIFSYSRVMQKEWKEFFLTCETGTYCLGNILKKTAKDYPGRVVGMQWKVHSAKLNIRDGQIIGELTGRVNCSADSTNESVPLFSAQIELAVPFQLKFSEGSLSARAVAWGGHATIDQSNIGKVLSIRVLEATRLFFLPEIRQGILDIMNEHETQYAIKLPRNVNFKSSRVKLYEDVVRIEADLCYKLVSCQTIPNDEWVGSKDIEEFTLNDVIVTTTTTTTTTPPTAIKTDVSGQTNNTFSVVNLLCCVSILIAVIF